MNIKTSMTLRKKIIALTLVAVLSVVHFVVSPIWAVTTGEAPDGSHTLSEIFPGAKHNYLAEQIGYYIDKPVTYKPLSKNDFDDVQAVSCPSSYVPSLEGLQYCRYLEILYLANNDISSAELIRLPELAQTLKVLNLSGNRIDSGGLKYFSGLTLNTLMLAKNKIDDSGLENLPNTLTDLDLSNNEIGDVGAKIISRLTNLAELDLSNNHIGIDGIKALVSAGIPSLKLDNQTVTLSPITDGRVEIRVAPPGGVEDIVVGSISNGGTIDKAKGEIVWRPQTESVTFSYRYAYKGYSGTVYVPFKYAPFVYTVVFDDLNGHITNVSVNDLDKVATPKEPTRKGDMFLGWSSAKDGTEPFDFNTPIEKNLNLYARWKPPKSLTYYKSICGVKITIQGTRANIQWGRVKSAKGYILYKYDDEKEKYVKIATLEGRDKNNWTQNGIASGEIHKYKVQSYKVVHGRTIMMKKSYWVNAISDSAKYDNAVKVQISPTKTVKKKIGKATSFKATVMGVEGKKLIDKKVRWCSSNQKIATVNEDGKVKFIKRGTCYIYAKAHNGVNSKRIKIVVQ